LGYGDLSPITYHDSLSSSTRPHPDVLHGLEKLALSLNRRGDDDFGLLKLGQVARANVPHARSNGTDKVLAAIVHFRGAEQNLF
jgi:hypothetical protein